MRSCAGSSAREHWRQRGFALLIVLWTLVLIGFVVAHITASGRTEAQIAGNLVSDAVARAAADGAISEAIFNLSNPLRAERWPLDGAVRQLRVGDSRVALRLEDESSRINPNVASPILLAALFQTLGISPDQSLRLAAAVTEWVGSVPSTRPPEALLAEYRAAGLDYRPPGAPLESLDELGQVLGMTPPLLAALRPHLTLFGPAEPNPSGTDPVVRAALALVERAAVNAPAQAAQQELSEVLTARITAVASGPGNARVTRMAVVRTGAMVENGYQVLAWGSRID